MNRLQKGFTLIELMITLAIVGILAAIATPAYQDYINKAEVSEAFLLMEPVKNEIEEMYAQTGDLAAIMATGGIGLRAKNFGSGKYTNVWTIQNGAIMTAMNGPGASKKFNYDYVILKPAETAGGSLIWSCPSYGGMPKRWLPAVCNQ